MKITKNIFELCAEVPELCASMLKVLDQPANTLTTAQILCNLHNKLSITGNIPIAPELQAHLKEETLHSLNAAELLTKHSKFRHSRITTTRREDGTYETMLNMDRPFEELDPIVDYEICGTVQEIQRNEQCATCIFVGPTKKYKEHVDMGALAPYHSLNPTGINMNIEYKMIMCLSSYYALDMCIFCKTCHASFDVMTDNATDYLEHILTHGRELLPDASMNVVLNQMWETFLQTEIRLWACLQCQQIFVSGNYYYLHLSIFKHEDDIRHICSKCHDIFRGDPLRHLAEKHMGECKCPQQCRSIGMDMRGHLLKRHISSSTLIPQSEMDYLLRTCTDSAMMYTVGMRRMIHLPTILDSAWSIADSSLEQTGITHLQKYGQLEWATSNVVVIAWKQKTTPPEYAVKRAKALPLTGLVTRTTIQRIAEVELRELKFTSSDIYNFQLAPAPLEPVPILKAEEINDTTFQNLDLILIGNQHLPMTRMTGSTKVLNLSLGYGQSFGEARAYGFPFENGAYFYYLEERLGLIPAGTKTPIVIEPSVSFLLQDPAIPCPVTYLRENVDLLITVLMKKMLQVQARFPNVYVCTSLFTAPECPKDPTYAAVNKYNDKLKTSCLSLNVGLLDLGALHPVKKGMRRYLLPAAMRDAVEHDGRINARGEKCVSRFLATLLESSKDWTKLLEPSSPSSPANVTCTEQ